MKKFNELIERYEEGLITESEFWQAVVNLGVEKTVTIYGGSPFNFQMEDKDGS